MKISAIADKLVKGDRRTLAKAITLVESTLPNERQKALELIDILIKSTGKALRIGISGMPGVGKSTFIEAFGSKQIASGHKVAVLAVDPSSPLTGGSIMGDRTRMESLSSADRAFIRPTPSGKTLGGVAQRTRESILLCEAAGYDSIIVETVGVGQSEAAVASMVDCFVLLQLPNAGDELQGIKKGVLELANIIAVTKNDGEYKTDAAQTKNQLERALMLTRGQESWQPPVILCSSVDQSGFDEFSAKLEDFQKYQMSSGNFDSNRNMQRIAWFETELNAGLLEKIKSDSNYEALILDMETRVKNGEIASSHAAQTIISQIL